MSNKRFLENMELQLQKAFLYLENEFIFNVVEPAESQAPVSSVIVLF